MAETKQTRIDVFSSMAGAGFVSLATLGYRCYSRRVVQTGDLLESKLKRISGVKDAGGMILDHILYPC